MRNAGLEEAQAGIKIAGLWIFKLIDFVLDGTSLFLNRNSFWATRFTISKITSENTSNVVTSKKWNNYHWDVQNMQVSFIFRN